MREFDSAHWVGFPKIDLQTQPVVSIVARRKWRTTDQAFSNSAVAAMITKYESRR